MKIFVTGATGYIGNRLAYRLAEEGHTVHVIIRNLSQKKNLDHPNIVAMEGDLRDPRKC